MDQEQLVRHFSTTNSVGLQSHCGDVDAWARGQVALLRDEMQGLRTRINQCKDGIPPHEDAHGLVQSTIFRHKLLAAFMRATQETLQETEHAPRLAGWMDELNAMSLPTKVH